MQPTSPQHFDLATIRGDFPVLSELVYGKPLVYLDNAATSQKPSSVIKALHDYYAHSNANIHRGVHYLSQKASGMFDEVRLQIRDFINAKSEREIIFTSGTTDSINLVASTFGRKFIGQGDEILISAMEHHSNIVPWQMLCEEKGAVLKVIPMDDDGVLILDAVPSLLSERTKLVSIVHTSNSLGTINPVKEIIAMAHKLNIPVLVDGAQTVAHEQVDVQELDCDFFVFSGHKMFGPTGVGCLYGKETWLEQMPPYKGGGDMIQSVSFEKTTYNELPFKFEAGTPHISGVIALGEAISYLNQIDRNAAHAHEMALLNKASSLLMEIEHVRIIGNSKNKSSVVSFIMDGVNAMDAGMYLDTLGIAVRTGHHCTEPVMHRFKIPGTIRASFMFYNTFEEVDKLVEGVQKAKGLLRRG
ncbi:MAG: aminotransferase class V-fold PLP-dependent enzyme [Bacteroidota bacterium]